MVAPPKIASPSQKTISPTANIFFKSWAMQQGNSIQKMCRVFGGIEFAGFGGIAYFEPVGNILGF
jgi:hypothetical protein